MRLMSVTCLLGRGLLHSRVHSQQHPCSFWLYSSSALMLEEDQVFDESPKFHANFVTNSCVAPVPRAERELFRLVVRVIKSLNWRVAREVRFGSWVESHGFSDSINSFRIIIHTFASAGMRLEVFALLRDIVGCCNEAKHDAFELFSNLLDSPSHPVETSSVVVVVFGVLMKVFASNSMLEHALDVFVRAKHAGLETDIMSCNFLLKCLVEANRVEFVRCHFEELRDSGPSPNIYTYTIMMNFYCREDAGRMLILDGLLRF